MIGVLILREEKLVIFLPGWVGKFFDRTSSGASGKDGIYLLLCGLEGHRFVILRDQGVIIINSKLISMHIKYHILGVIVVIIFVARTVCLGIIVIVIVIISATITIITIITVGIIVITGGIIRGVVVQGLRVISLTIIIIAVVIISVVVNDRATIVIVIIIIIIRVWFVWGYRIVLR